MHAVFDTNVWLDWLVFDGNELVDLRDALVGGRLSVTIDAPCFDELARVLAYPEFGLDAQAIQVRLEEVRKLTRMHSPNDADALQATSLPRCQDPDDQKFLVLASAAKAHALVTRDKALLRLAGRARRRCGFDIVPPANLAIPAQS